MLPNLITIGAMKSATSSLHYYLNLHPEISMSKRKELDFFVAEKNWNKGIKWYESHFRVNTHISGESSSSYTKYPGFVDVPKRMNSVLPQVKLVYVLRDPVERIISHYIHNYAQRREDRTIVEAFTNLKQNYYVDCSKYYLQLQQFLKFYEYNNILIITAEDLKNHRLATLQNVFKFLEVDDQFYSQEFSRMLHLSADKKRKNWFGLLLSRGAVGYKFEAALPKKFLKICRLLSGTQIKRPLTNERLKQHLIESLRNDVNSLRKFTGMEFKHWCL